MLGYTAPSNDVYIFFENNEIEKLETGRITGLFINFYNPDVIGSLEATVDDSISDLIRTPTIKDDSGNVTKISLLMKRNIYDRLKKRRTYESHEGFRHVFLRDANNLPFEDQGNYEQLRKYASRRVLLSD